MRMALICFFLIVIVMMIWSCRMLLQGRDKGFFRIYLTTIVLLPIMMSVGCGKTAGKEDVAMKNEPVQIESDQSHGEAEPGKNAEIVGGSAKQDKEKAENPNKPKQTGKIKEKQTVSDKVIGGVGNGKVIAGLKGTLKLSDNDEDKLAKLSDSIDLAEVENMSDVNKAKLVEALDVLVSRHDGILGKLKSTLSQADVAVDIDPTTGKIIMEESILFATNEYEISEEGKSFLDKFIPVYAKAILDIENEQYIQEVRIEGNADTKGDYDYNLKLSQKRADAVKAYCEKSDLNGMAEEDKTAFLNKLVTVGNSYDDPVYDDEGEIDMAASRRVEFKFFLNLKE